MDLKENKMEEEAIYYEDQDIYLNDKEELSKESPENKIIQENNDNTVQDLININQQNSQNNIQQENNQSHEESQYNKDKIMPKTTKIQKQNIFQFLNQKYQEPKQIPQEQIEQDQEEQQILKKYLKKQQQYLNKQEYIPYELLMQFQPITWKIRGRIEQKSKLKRQYNADNFEDYFLIKILDKGQDLSCKLSSNFFNQIYQNKIYSFESGILYKDNQDFEIEFKETSNIQQISKGKNLQLGMQVENLQLDSFAELDHNLKYWAIHAKVTKKNQKRTSKNGDYFSTELLDQKGNICSCSFFGELAEYFYELLETQKFYEFKNGKIKKNKDNFLKKFGEFQIIFDYQDETCITELAHSDCFKSQGNPESTTKPIYNEQLFENFPEIFEKQLSKANFKAKIITIFPIKYYHSQFSSGQVSDILLQDKSNNQLTATLFNEVSIKFAQMLVQGKIYEFKNVQIKRDQYKGFKAVIEPYSEIILIENIQQSFQSIENLLQHDENNQLQNFQQFSICGIVENSFDLEQIKQRNDQILFLRKIEISDESQQIITVVIYGQQAQQINLKRGQIITIDSVRLKHYRGQNQIAFNERSKMKVDEISTEREKQLLAYKESNSFRFIQNSHINNPVQKNQIQIKKFPQNQIQQFKSLQEIQQNAKYLIYGEKQYYFTSVFILSIKNQKLYFLSCSKCQRKINQENYCINCEKYLSEDEVRVEYNFQAFLADQSSSLYATFFQAGNQLFQFPAKNIKELEENNQDYQVQQVVKNLSFQEIKCKISCQLNKFNGEEKLEYKVLQIYEYDCKQENQQMIDQLNEQVQQKLEELIE